MQNTTKVVQEQKASLWKGINRVRVSDFVIAFVILILSLTCILPFIHVAAKSISSNTAVMSKSVYLWPKDINFDAYASIFKDGQLTYSMGYTVLVTVLFTLIGMIVTICAAYPLSIKGLKGRSFFSFFLMFTMYFSAGLIPEYLLMSSLGLLNTMWVLVLPLAFSPYNMLIMRSFLVSTIPDSLYEAAKLDGANHFQTLFKIVLPLSKAVIAVITLYYAVGHWNAYFNAMIYLNDRHLHPLQLVLREILVENSIEALDVATEDAQASLAELLKYALIIVSTVPILCVYPFVQKYFMKGVMIGSVKG